MVSVPFHQIMRSTTPIFAILIYRIIYGRSYSASTYLSLIPLVVGVVLTTYGDYYFTRIGFACTLLGTVLAATKTIVTNRLMTGSLALPALEILLRMSPLAAVQSLGIAYFTGETVAFQAWVAEGHLTTFTLFALAGNGAIAFLLNISSFETNKIAGALTITVCGNVKQSLTILFGIVLFNVRVGPLNGFGMLLALLGAAWYSKIELKKRSGTPTTPVRLPSLAGFAPLLQEKIASRQNSLSATSPLQKKMAAGAWSGIINKVPGT
jgi:drug/metabolite transporter (DMT)-like permease